MTVTEVKDFIFENYHQRMRCATEGSQERMRKKGFTIVCN